MLALSAICPAKLLYSRNPFHGSSSSRRKNSQIWLTADRESHITVLRDVRILKGRWCLLGGVG